MGGEGLMTRDNYVHVHCTFVYTSFNFLVILLLNCLIAFFINWKPEEQATGNST